MRGSGKLMAAVILLSACGDPATTGTTADLAARNAAATSHSFGPTVQKELASLRRATAAFQRFEVAGAAGWNTQITGCMVDPGGAGGMGFHYGNVGLIDGSVQVEQPELLLYEPEKNGRMRLVAVEYIIPYAFHPRDADPPVLFDQEFKQVDAFGLWGLHAWVWRENPSGMFADWNPKVDCANATDVMAMAH
jgi:hypothetical protein